MGWFALYWAHQLLAARSGESDGDGPSVLGLLLGRAHHQPIELFGDLDLTREARIRPHVIAEIEHIFLHWSGLTDLGPPGLVHVNVAGRAGTGAAAFRLDARYVVTDCRLHHGRTDLAGHRAGGAAVVDIGDFRHRLGSGKCA